MSGVPGDEQPRLLIAEHITGTGEPEQTLLECGGSALRLTVTCGSATELLELPVAALAAVMQRYGRPALDDLELPSGTTWLTLDSGARITTFRHLARFDVIARDYVLYCEPAAEPLAALSTHIAAALRHLGRAAR